MKNRAKCKLCQTIIESFHDSDYVPCKCGHISVSGGPKMECSALDWHNFLRVDDLGNEIIVKVVPSIPDSSINISSDPTRNDLLKMLDDLIESFEKMPPVALHSNVTQQELYSVLILISSLFRS